MVKSNAKRTWLILIFAGLILASFLFVWWISFSNFKSSFHEIKQQYYSVVADQVVSELESSIKYGKSLDSFYNVNSIFDKLNSLLSDKIKAAITNTRGEILYESYSNEAESASYSKAILHPKVASKLRNSASVQGYATVIQDNYEIMILPICDKSNEVIGNFLLLYPIAAINDELQPQRTENLKITLLIMIVPLIVLIAFFLIVPVKKESEADMQNRRKLNKILYLIPVIVVLIGISLQSATMYTQYRQKYKNAISDGAYGILAYMENSIKSMNEKGVPYERMYGLSEYLTDKVESTPILWNIRVTNVIAETKQELSREDEWTISAPLIPGGSSEKTTQIEVQISRRYMDQKMMNMLLVFLVTLIVGGIVIFEIMRLPDVLMFRRSTAFSTNTPAQYEKTTSALRITTFIPFMGIYASMPFSAILIRQWNTQMLRLSADVTASLPMTAELLAVMLFSLVFARFLKGVSLKLCIFGSGALIIGGNLLCVTAGDPLMLIIYRLMCGVGFAGIKHVINGIISYGSETRERTRAHIAAMNAGLLGGIMCGGSLGAVIAGSMGIAFTFTFTAAILLVFMAVIVYTTPWRLLKQNFSSARTEGHAKQSNVLNIFSKGTVWRYIVLVTLPLNLGLMFIVAFIPSYIQKMNIPVLVISYGYLLNGIVGIYMGPFLAKLLTRSFGKNLCVSIMLAIGGLSIVILDIEPSIAIILISTALMGLFDGYGSPVAMDYFIEMPAVRGRVDVASSLAVLGVLGNTTQMISPVIYGWLMMIPETGGVNTITLLGIVYFAFAVMFMAPFRKEAYRIDA